MHRKKARIRQPLQSREQLITMPESSRGFETSLHSPINASTQPKQSLREKGVNRRNTQSSMQACSALMSHMRLRASNGPQMSGGELLQLQKMASSGPKNMKTIEKSRWYTGTPKAQSQVPGRSRG